ncbi:CD4-1 molecule [Xyrichtys novacula]|nr:CD4-1 molecule [Xyrichtys novacula]
MKNIIQSILLLTAVLETVTGKEELVYAQLGDTVTLKTPERGAEKEYMYWYLDDINSLQIAWRNPLGGSGFIGTTSNPIGQHWSALSWSGNSLVIKNLKPENFMTVVLRFGNGEIFTYRLLELIISGNPTSPLLPGDDLNMICSADTFQNYKNPEIYWKNPQGEITNQGRLQVKVTGRHDGRWTCVATRGEKESEAKVFVTVVDFSPNLPIYQYTSESSSLTIPCSIPQSISWDKIKAGGIQEVNWHFYPKPAPNLISNNSQRLFHLPLDDKLTWKKEQNRDLTPVPDLKKGFLSLTRRFGRDEDRGDYVCSMKVQNGVTLNRTVQVKVLQLTSAPGTELISGQQVNLTCSLGEPLPPGLSLTWVPPEESSLTSGDHPAHLIIPEVGVGDGGEWRCELRQSDKRLTFAAITLNIEPKLSVWMLVIICSVTVIVVLLLILVFIIYRRRQRKTTHLRHRLCKCKNPKPRGFYRT